jgi:hypothetical protein
VLRCCDAPKAAGEVMNVATGGRISLNELLNTMNQLLGTNIQAIYREERAGDVRDSQADISKAESLLGYKPPFCWKKGCDARSTGAAVKAQPPRAPEGPTVNIRRQFPAASALALAVVVVVVRAAPVDPAAVPLEELAAIRGAMWTARHPLQSGPRPGKPTNILALSAIAGEAPEVREAAFRAYTSRGYTHGVAGAWQPQSYSPYHKVYPQQNLTFEQYLDLLQQFWDHGIKPVVFVKPDDWSCQQLESLTPFYSQPRAQRLVRIAVPGGWEPNKDTSNAEWICWLQWGRRVLPNALSLLHMEADVDVPGNQEDQKALGIPGHLESRRATRARLPRSECRLCLQRQRNAVGGIHQELHRPVPSESETGSRLPGGSLYLGLCELADVERLGHRETGSRLRRGIRRVR